MLVEFSHSLLNCNFSLVPPELFTHTAVSFSRLGPLRPCVASHTKDDNLNDCRVAILHKCSGNIAKSITNNCPHSILFAMNASQQKDIQSEHISSEFLEYVKCREDFAVKVIPTCLEDLKTRCISKRFVVLKALRLNIETVKHLLERDPDLYVLYLVRDPRSTVSSRVNIWYTYTDTYNNPVLEAKYLCQRMLHDLRIFFQLRKQFPNALKMIRYEDLVRNRFFTVGEVYSFLNSTMHHSLTKWLQMNYLKQPENDYIFGTSRKDSLDSLSKWKTKIPISHHKRMNKQCKDVLNYLDYKMK